MHSGFLVAAVLVFRDASGGLHAVEGANAETCVLGSAICAERCAATQLRLHAAYVDAATTPLVGVYITTLAAGEGGGDVCAPRALVTPGLLCREFMSSLGAPAAGGSGCGAEGVRVLLCSADWLPARDAHSGELTGRPGASARGAHAVYRLSDLYPHAPRLSGTPRARVAEEAAAFSARAAAFAPDVCGLSPAAGSPLAAAVAGGGAAGAAAAIGSALESLYARALLLARRGDSSDDLYPLALAAGILLADGRALLAREHKALEWGCTLEAPLALAGALAEAAAAGAPPLAMLLVDQFGALHAPHAKTRAWMHERGHGDCVVYTHAADGALVRVTASALYPAAPHIRLTQAGEGVRRMT